MNIKKWLLCIVGVFISFCLVGCIRFAHFPSALAEAQDAYVHFNTQGWIVEGSFYKSRSGIQDTQRVKVSGGKINQSAKWSYVHCLDQNENVVTMIESDTRISNDWVTFSIDKSEGFIYITVKPNETGRMRKIIFVGTGKKRTFKIHVYQD